MVPAIPWARLRARRYLATLLILALVQVMLIPSARAELSPSDATPPTLQSAAVDGAALTLTYSEALDTTSVPAATDFTVAGTTSTVSTLAVAGTTVTLTLSAAANPGDTVTLSYTVGASPIQDAAGNDAAALTNQAVTNNTPDTTPPTLVSAVINKNNMVITFSEPLNSAASVPNSAFQAVSDGTFMTTNSIAISGSKVTITFNPAVNPGANVMVSYFVYSTNWLEDLAGNDVAKFVNHPVTNNTPETTPPVLSVATVNGSTLTLTYNEGLDTNSVPAATDFTVAGTTSTVSSVAVAGTTVTLTLSAPVSAGEVVKVSYTASTSPIQDAAGNAAAALTNQVVTNNTPDTTAPALSTAAVNGATLTLTYNEGLDTNSVPAATDFTVAGTTSTVSSVAVAGTTVTLTLATPVTEGAAVTVSYTVGVSPVQDTAGNDAAALTDQAVTNETDNTAPTLLTLAINGNTLLLTYNEPLNDAVVPHKGQFDVDTETWGYIDVESVQVAGSSMTLILANAVEPGEQVYLAYNDVVWGGELGKRLQDLAGNLAPLLEWESVPNNTPDLTPPTFLAAVVDGRALTATYSEALDPGSAPAPGDFTITVAGKPSTATSVAISGVTVALNLTSPVAAGNAVTLSYTPGVAPLQDAAGNDVTSLADQAVTNITPPPPPPRPPAFVTISAPVNETRDATVSVSGTANPGALVTVGGTTASASSAGSWTAVVALAEGSNTITATNGSASQSLLITRDSTPPVVALTASESETFAESVLLTATTEAGATLTIAGEAVGTGSGSHLVTLVIGSNTFTATAQDRLGNKGSATITVVRKEQPPEPVAADVDPAEPAEVTGINWIVNIPAGSADQTLGLTVAPPSDSTPVDQVQGAADVAGAAEMTAQGRSTGEAVHTFKQKLKLTFRYDPTQFPDPSRLAIYWYDRAAKTWVRIGGVVDPTNGLITVEVDHFTLFAVLAANEVAPTLDPLPTTTDVRTITVTGQAAAGSTVTLVLNGTEAATGTADDAGAYTLSAALEEGRNLLYVKGSGILASSEAVLTFTPAKETKPEEARLTDISGHWAELPIAHLAGLGIVAGFEDRTYRPDLTITRAEFTVLLARALNLPGATDLSRFTDAATIADWARADVAAAAAVGIVNGRANGSFDPDAKITRAEAAVMLAGALRYKGLTATGQTPALSDFVAVPEWAKGSVQAAVHYGIITGYEDSTFRSGNLTTRAEVAVILTRLLDAK